MKTIDVRIKRQASPKQPFYWENYELQIQDDWTVAQALRFFQKRAVTSDNQAVAPVVWESENQLGREAGLLLINGKPLSPDSTYLKDLSTPVRIAPLSKFPVIRDLLTDDGSVLQARLEMEVWRKFEGFHQKGEAHLLSRVQTSKNLNSLLACTSCKACLEACPNYGAADYYGIMPLVESYRLEVESAESSVGSITRNRWRSAAGIAGCDNTQNCVKVCPENVALLDLVGELKKNYNQTRLD